MHIFSTTICLFFSPCPAGAGRGLIIPVGGRRGRLGKMRPYFVKQVPFLKDWAKIGLGAIEFIMGVAEWSNQKCSYNLNFLN